ncbi:hypothetical protein F2Q68_00011476 [Brassica cretica]|uniref:Bifunctional inhibitor/plant lipid transfer protein/seed storage helical domain-containing protein n=1 Tax=Brassica cretica TaxID=69181 RepID=A0A8S9KZT3_BRACR|nr:hypothetical protein F2Q68_00011476 [Brassica cretica]
MASKAYSILFISLILTCMRSVRIPKAKATYVKYHSCHTVKDCIKDIDCLIAPVQCLESRCTCILISPLSSRKNLNLKPAETPLGCKTASDCEDKLICVFGKSVCENSQYGMNKMDRKYRHVIQSSRLNSGGKGFTAVSSAILVGISATEVFTYSFAAPRDRRPFWCNTCPSCDSGHCVVRGCLSL